MSSAKDIMNLTFPSIDSAGEPIKADERSATRSVGNLG
ncbi:hypothetical protein LT85_1799 [Collimonas arenae]|uniref:Uncharacterized protein n=1 Tax=Collimonas arenae TaxID=279058 RepID=A0A0A1FDM1_9BURK|nr:hypothetical protein LT85_1799 [Collimonas arenae]